MAAESISQTSAASVGRGSSRLSSWCEAYSRKHRLQRVRSFPAGIVAPRKVRIYARCEHFILQWWDVGAKRTLTQRVTGDLIDAIAEARRIETRLANFKTSGRGTSKLEHGELVAKFHADLVLRANAGELAASTVERYRSALNHYRAFCEQPDIFKKYPKAVGVNRDFRLALTAHLTSSLLRHKASGQVGVVRNDLVLGAVRAMFNWAADPDRGNLLPEGFRNPFNRTAESLRRTARDPFGEPDITTAMAVEFIEACDAFQLRLFATLIMYGLRAAEPLYLFHEHLEGPWLKLICLPEIEYLTKGQRDKRFPLLQPLEKLLKVDPACREGLIFTRRGIQQVSRQTPFFGASLAKLAEEYRRQRCAAGNPSVLERSKIRERLLRDAGGLNYDQIEHEFQSIARELKWPRTATLKDFRHLFSTCLENAGVPEFYRRYFMGQSPGKTPIATYTHLNELQGQFAKALQIELAPLVAAIGSQAATLNALSPMAQ